MEYSVEDAKFKLLLLDAKAVNVDKIDLTVQLTNAGIAQEVITRIDELWEKTLKIGDEVVRIGQIIIVEIVKFVKENPHLSTGIALGAAVGALVSMIPFLGPLLAPLSTVIGMFIGAYAGAKLDRGDKVSKGTSRIPQEMILIAKKFFELFAQIFNSLKNEYKAVNA
jgi:hypothetical protein